MLRRKEPSRFRVEVEDVKEFLAVFSLLGLNAKGNTDESFTGVSPDVRESHLTQANMPVSPINTGEKHEFTVK